MGRNGLYKAVVDIGQKYLGPAGERFMRRQIDAHLGVPPEEITVSELPKLVDWSGAAFAMLSEDVVQQESFKEELLALANYGKRGSHAKKTQ